MGKAPARATISGTAIIVAAALWLAAAARAADVAPPVDDVEIAELFAAFCLKAFPEPFALDRLAQARSATAMTPDEVKSYLHADPGRGWHLRTAQARYAITIESPPYHACAVRRVTPSGVSTVQHYIDAVKAYVGGRSGTLVNGPPQKTRTPEGVDIAGYPYALLDASGKTTETFIVILTNYHGRMSEQYRAEAAGGVGVEVRMVHQFPPQ